MPTVEGDYDEKNLDTEKIEPFNVHKFITLLQTLIDIANQKGIFGNALLDNEKVGKAQKELAKMYLALNSGRNSWAGECKT